MVTHRVSHRYGRLHQLVEAWVRVRVRGRGRGRGRGRVGYVI